MGVGNADEVEDALDIAILAPAAMQRIEDDIWLLRLDRLDQRWHIARDVNRGDLIAGLLQGGHAIGAAVERDLALRRRTAHQDRNALHALSPFAMRAWAAGRPMRLISQTSSTPLLSRTRRRTSSP